MGDNYQAVYDAVRSMISNGNVGEAVENVMRNASIDQYFSRMTDAFHNAAGEHERPSVLFRPTLTKDGDTWIALYGENLQTGISAHGATPAAAMYAFDEAWRKA